MIFEDWGKRYLESGFSVIPCRGKRPLVKDWQQYANRLPSEQEFDAWNAAYPGANIGLVLGPASNLSAVDIDTEEPAVHAAVPPSNVIRKGKKGEVRFFRYSPIIQSLKKHDVGVEVFSSSGQVILPPSIHPETKQPYLWTHGDLLDERPETTLDSVAWLSALGHADLAQAPGLPGRNNKLKEIVTAVLVRGEPTEKASREAYQYDLENHSPRLFLDPKEAVYKGTGELAAKLAADDFTLSVARSLVKARQISLSDPLPEIPLIVDFGGNAEKTEKPQQDTVLPLPEPTGLMREIRDLIIADSYRANSMLAYGASVAFLGALFSNRFCAGEIWPNVYVLNIAPSGAGKSIPQGTLKRVLYECGELSNLTTRGLYKSGVAIAEGLQSNRERFDIIDEASEIFRQIKFGRGERGDIEKTLCELWSAGPTQFLNSVAAGRADTGTCWNPCVSILGSTTQDAFRQSVNRGLMENGLLPRFLIFEERGYSETLERSADTRRFRDVVEKVKRIFAIERRFEAPSERNLVVNQNKVVRARPVECTFSRGAQLLKKEIVRTYSKEIETAEPIWRPFISRGVEQILRLTLIKTCGDERTSIGADDLAWARDFYHASFTNAQKLLRLSGVENEQEALSRRVEEVIRDAGTISLTDFYAKTRFLNKMQRKAIIDDLTEAGAIAKMQSTSKSAPGKAALFYVWTSKSRFI